MLKLTRFLFVHLSAAGFAVLVLAETATAAPRGFCEDYADRAVRQQERNLDRRCGLRGPRWNLRHRDHYGWCVRVSVDRADRETAIRRRQLRNCSDGGYDGRGGREWGGRRGFCEDYADTAVRQQRRNLNRRCGLRGPRWSSRYQSHYDWCLRVNRDRADRETAIRRSRLRDCR